MTPHLPDMLEGQQQFKVGERIEKTRILLMTDKDKTLEYNEYKGRKASLSPFNPCLHAALNAGRCGVQGDFRQSCPPKRSSNDVDGIPKLPSSVLDPQPFWFLPIFLTLMIIRALSRPISARPSSILTASFAVTRAMHITSIPMWTGTSNNYAYLVKDDKSNDAVIIDPANPEEVTPTVKNQIDAGNVNLTAIVNTHHHWDHAGGNKKFQASDVSLKAKDLPIIGGKDCEGVTRTPKHEETFKIGTNITVKALHTPCHTQDSICYYMTDGADKAVFTGDTLFIGGCGRFFEGTPAEMNTALNEILAKLPDDTKVYPGHEYTKQNVKFLVTVEQTEAVKNLEKFAENNKETQGKFTIGDEKTYNAFMRLGEPSIEKATGKTGAVDVMGKLREMKNSM